MKASAARKTLAVVTIIAAMSLLAACSPRQVPAPSSEPTEESVIEAAWSPESDCTTCHTTEASSMDSSTCAASFHASSDCADCHSNADGLAKAHEKATADGKMPAKLKKTEVDEETCLACHGSYESLAEKTTDFTLLTDKNGTTVNPHEVTTTGTGHNSINCASCHSMHQDGSAGDTADTLCRSCHHKEVYECGTCH